MKRKKETHEDNTFLMNNVQKMFNERDCKITL